MKTICEIFITPDSVTLCGNRIPVTEKGDKLLVELYRKFINDYPKFFKMDTLSRLSFVASELLIKKEAEITPNIATENRAVILANNSASIKNDTDFSATISDPDNYFPSPALFVYTLPNITTGEIAIRNHYFGESSFYVLRDESCLNEILESTPFDSALVGWVECPDSNDFNAHLSIVKK